MFVTIDNGCKIEFERSAAYKAAVDVGLSHKSLAVSRVHRTAVLNYNFFRAVGAEELTKLFADVSDSFLGLFVGRGLARADRPYGFVSYNEFGEILDAL